VGRDIGFGTTIRVVQGTEFVSSDLDPWAYQRGVTLDISYPGKPTDNRSLKLSTVASKWERLNAHWFVSGVAPVIHPVGVRNWRNCEPCSEKTEH
jgi:putative transposase